jgi:hypothetical protein
MYRIMLYCHLFPGNRYSQEDIDPDDEELIDKIRKQRTAILSEYPTDDLRELNSAVKFLCSVFDSVTDARTLSSHSASLSLTTYFQNQISLKAFFLPALLVPCGLGKLAPTKFSKTTST